MRLCLLGVTDDCLCNVLIFEIISTCIYRFLMASWPIPIATIGMFEMFSLSIQCTIQSADFD